MKFNLPKSYRKKQKEIFDLKYIDFNGELVHVSDLRDRSVTPEMKKQMRMNSYAQDDMPPKLTNEALIETVEHYLTHVVQHNFPCLTYEESIIHRLVPELVERLKEVQSDNVGG